MYYFSRWLLAHRIVPDRVPNLQQDPSAHMCQDLLGDNNRKLTQLAVFWYTHDREVGDYIGAGAQSSAAAPDISLGFTVLRAG